MDTSVSKREFIRRAGAALGAIALGASSDEVEAGVPETFEINRSPEEWRARLTPPQFAVLRQARTERAGSSPLDREHRRGIFVCAGCDLPVYNSNAKFDSGTGWPSFSAPIKGSVRTKRERSFFGTQTEVHCRRCGGHLGHVFNDGPAPTGKRYCMNGAALKFIAAAR